MKQELRSLVTAGVGANAAKALLAELLALNQQVAPKLEKTELVTAPGVSEHPPDAKQLVAEDCILPLSPAEDGRHFE